MKKETKNDWKEGQRNTNMKKEVTTKQEKESIQSLKPQDPNWIIYT
jgi:hypothetical protein